MAIYLKIYLVVHLMVSVNYQGAYATIGHKGVQSNLIFLDLGLVYQMHYILNLENNAYQALGPVDVSLYR